MLDCLKYRPQLHHASNLGAPIAYRIAQKANCKAYIYDAVAVDEMEEIYRITGIKDIFRIGRGHNLKITTSSAFIWAAAFPSDSSHTAGWWT